MIPPERMVELSENVIANVLQGADEVKAQAMARQINTILAGQANDTCFLALVVLVSAMVRRLPNEGAQSVMVCAFAAMVDGLVEELDQ